MTWSRAASAWSARQRHDELLLPEQRRGELLAERVGVDRREGAVELVGAQPREQLVLRVLDHVDRDAGVAGAEVGEHRRRGRTARSGTCRRCAARRAAGRSAPPARTAGRRPRAARGGRSRGSTPPSAVSSTGGSCGGRPRRRARCSSRRICWEIADCGEVELLAGLRERAGGGRRRRWCAGDGAPCSRWSHGAVDLSKSRLAQHRSRKVMDGGRPGLAGC